MASRPWTAEQLDQLRAACAGRFAGQVGWNTVAGLVGRSPHSCRQQAHKHNFYWINAKADYGPRFICFLRRRHADGWSDEDVAKAWGGTRRCVGRHRRRLGLRSNTYNGRHRAKSAATMFKPGERHGAAARRHSAIGTVVVRCRERRGYRQRWIKIRDHGPPTKRWVPLAVLVWRRAHGPIPPGAFVVHRDGKTLNDNLDNLMLLTRSELPAWQRSVWPKVEARRRARTSEAMCLRHRIARAHRAKREEYHCAI